MDTVLAISGFALWSAIVAWVNYHIGYNSATYDMTMKELEELKAKIND